VSERKTLKEKSLYGLNFQHMFMSSHHSSAVSNCMCDGKYLICCIKVYLNCSIAMPRVENTKLSKLTADCVLKLIIMFVFTKAINTLLV